MPKKILHKIKEEYQALPEKKKYLELVTTILSIPILLTVLITNTNNLKNSNSTKIQAASEPIKNESVRPEKVVTIIREITPTVLPTINPSVPPTTIPVNNFNATETLPTKAECKKTVGPVDIISPSEGQVISKDPLSIDISYNTGEYCRVAWSWRLNGSEWSEYTDKSINIYNLTNGTKNLEVRVKSIVSSDEIVLKRTFSYIKTDQITPTSIPGPT
ncbi:MAG: hypothetical protein UT63_C0050G0002 [Candidatus Gottesmanbacteria bacterium GW2011_GWC2_39_8]|uniref:Uncharacterized protein n=1 Tax=Candidatus Gottesmanbacteria bacterium GW2011_GWC2_39_8 TaxID=1618450 RepID=A0A0G0PW82_9BACT|nr:MAG: hypothetical protein UT63_C0050G0002 [Candidatus Gottesmanbacteria bacterium GW2011_GWC2_39_8]